MKKLMAVLSALLVPAGVFCAIYGVADIRRTAAALAATPGTGGSDYLGLGWGYGLILLGIAAAGILCSAIGLVASHGRWGKLLFAAALTLFVILTICSFAVGGMY